jgi:hypothetical protein
MVCEASSRCEEEAMSVHIVDDEQRRIASPRSLRVPAGCICFVGALLDDVQRHRLLVPPRIAPPRSERRDPL